MHYYIYMSTNTNTQIDNITTKNGSYNVKIAPETLNAFVSPSNYISSVTLPFDTKSDGFIESELSGSNEEKFNPKLTQNLHYSTCWERQSDINIDIQGVRYSQNKALFGLNFTNKGEADAADTDTCSSGEGLAHPFHSGISGFSTDIMNASIQSLIIKLGSTAHTVNNSLNPTLVNNLRLMVDKEVLHNEEYMGQLHPDTLNLEHMKQSTNQLRVIPYDFTLSNWTLPGFVNSEAINTTKQLIITTADAFTNKVVNNNNMLTLKQVNEMENNQFAFNKRGNIYQHAEFKFIKSIESNNYEFVFNDGSHAKAKIIGLDKNLYTMKIGVDSYPTNVKNWEDCIAMGISVYDLIWYCDKLNFTVKKITAAAPADGNAVSHTNLVFSDVEPVNQSLTIKLSFKNVKSPLLSQIFEDSSNIRSFTNLKSLEISLTHHANNSLNNMFHVIAKNGNSIHLTDATVNSADFTGKYTITESLHNNGNLNISFGDSARKPRLNYKFWKMSSLIAPYKSVKSTLPFNEIKTDKVPFSVQVNEDDKYKSYRTFSEIRVQSNVKDLSTGIPKYVMIYADTPINYRFKSLGVRYDSGSNVQLLNMASLREATKRNGMWLFSKKHENGFMVNSNSSLNKYASNLYGKLISGSGSVLFLEMGVDVMITDASIAGQSSVKHNLEFFIELEFDKLAAGVKTANPHLLSSDSKYNNSSLQTCSMYFNYLSEATLFIEGDECTSSKPILATNDVVSIMNNFADSVQHNDLVVNTEDQYTAGMYSNNKKSNRMKKLTLKSHAKETSPVDDNTPIPVDNIADWMSK